MTKPLPLLNSDIRSEKPDESLTLGSPEAPALRPSNLRAGFWRTWVISAILASLSLSGCVVGPDFATPATPNLQLDYLAKQSLIGQPSTTLDQWWSAFGDSTLNELLNRAQAQNMTLHEAYERIVEARANDRLVGGQLEVQFQEADFESIRQTLFADIVASYLHIRLFQSQLALLEQNMLIQEHTAQLVSQRSAAGVSTELDNSQTHSFSYRTRALYVALNQKLELEYNNLNLLMGQTPDFVLQDFVGIAPLPVMPSIPDAGLPADLIRRRPDVRRQETAVQATSALIGVAQSDLFPRLSLLGNVGVSSQNLSRLFQTDGLNFEVGPSLTRNIFHFGRIKDNIEVHEAQFRQSVAAWQQSVLTAVREVEDAMVNHKGFMEQTENIARAIEADERAVELSLERYRAGKANFQRVIDSQQQLVDDQQQRFQFEADAMVQLVRLFKAAGGDWTVGYQTVNGCQTCSDPAGMVQFGTAPIEFIDTTSIGAFDTNSFGLAPETVTFVPQAQPMTSNIIQPPVGSSYPLNTSQDFGSISEAASPFFPVENQSNFINPPPEAAEPLQNARGIPQQLTQPRAIPQAVPTQDVPPTSDDNWLWN